MNQIKFLNRDTGEIFTGQVEVVKQFPQPLGKLILQHTADAVAFTGEHFLQVIDIYKSVESFMRAEKAETEEEIKASLAELEAQLEQEAHEAQAHALDSLIDEYEYDAHEYDDQDELESRYMYEDALEEFEAEIEEDEISSTEDEAGASVGVHHVN